MFQEQPSTVFHKAKFTHTRHIWIGFWGTVVILVRFFLSLQNQTLATINLVNNKTNSKLNFYWKFFISDTQHWRMMGQYLVTHTKQAVINSDCFTLWLHFANKIIRPRFGDCPYHKQLVEKWSYFFGLDIKNTCRKIKCMASCFHMFSHVWKLWWKTCTRFWNITYQTTSERLSS